SDEHGVVGGETQNEQDRNALRVECGELDAGAAELEIRGQNSEVGLHRLRVVGDKASEVLQVSDFAALECLHGNIPDHSRNRCAIPKIEILTKENAALRRRLTQWVASLACPGA